jgi:hypothetical protein
MGSQNDEGWIRYQVGDDSSSHPWKIYGKVRSAQSSSQTDPRMSRSNGDTSCQDFIQTCEDNPNFLIAFFSFVRWKLPSEERGFRMLKIFRKTWRPNWTLFLLEVFGDCFRKFLNDSNKRIQVGGDYFKWKWNNFWFPCIFFYSSPGIVSLNHVIFTRFITKLLRGAE